MFPYGFIPNMQSTAVHGHSFPSFEVKELSSNKTNVDAAETHTTVLEKNVPKLNDNYSHKH